MKEKQIRIKNLTIYPWQRYRIRDKQHENGRKKEYFWKNKRTIYFCQRCCNQGKQNKQNEVEACECCSLLKRSFVAYKEKFEG